MPPCLLFTTSCANGFSSSPPANVVEVDSVKTTICIGQSTPTRRSSYSTGAHSNVPCLGEVRRSAALMRSKEPKGEEAERTGRSQLEAQDTGAGRSGIAAREGCRARRGWAKRKYAP